jgi:hypothetical protein
MASSAKAHEAGLADVMELLKAMQTSQARLASEVESVSQRLDALGPSTGDPNLDIVGDTVAPPGTDPIIGSPTQSQASTGEPGAKAAQATTTAAAKAQEAGFTSRIVLT